MVVECRQEVEKRAFPWTPRERFPFASTSAATWENGFEHSGSLRFADTEEVTGSNPVAPTNKPLTSGNAVALTITALSRRNAGQVAV